MASRYFCDNCGNQTEYRQLMRFLTFSNHPVGNLELCLKCFDKHWKLETDKEETS